MQRYNQKNWIITGILILLFISPATAAMFRVNEGTGCMPVSSDLTVRVALTDIPTGLSGLNVSFTLSDPDTAQIASVTFPDWAKLNDMSPIPAQQVWIRMVDLDKKINPNDSEAPIATVSVRGLKPGNVVLTINPTRVEDDAGNNYSTSPLSQPLCFSGSSGSYQPAASQQPAASRAPGTSPEIAPQRTTYTPLPVILPVLSCLLIVVVMQVLKRTRRG